jgi:single-strand DNA-binding protein
MKGINKVILVGNVGRDAELKYTTGGTAVARFSLATNESWTSKTGEKQEHTEWHKIVVWKRQAEIAGEYVKKGRQLYVEGSLKTNQWEDKDGNKRNTTEITGFNFMLLGSRGEGAARAGGGSEEAGTGAEPEGGPPAFQDDDIPF